MFEFRSSSCKAQSFSLCRGVLFSCKISHSIVTFLDRRGEDLQGLYEHSDWPAEFLRDPSYWLEADKMESLLEYFRKEYAHTVPEGSFIREVGHQCKNLRSWGVLDSVLRMVQSPKDLFAQPERFLSYFVSPAPPIGNLRRDFDSVRFEVPISSSQYPLVVEYVCAALEALPTYMGKSMAQVEWVDSRIFIRWSDQQVSFFDEGAETEHNLHPELLQSILVNLENSQKQLEETKRLLMSKDMEVQELRRQMNNPATPAAQAPVGNRPSASPAPIEKVRFAQERAQAPLPLEHQTAFVAKPTGVSPEQLAVALGEAVNHVYKLNDYMARSQQLVTLLVAQDRNTRPVQEAMRRVDWGYILAESPQLTKQTVALLKEVQKNIRDLAGAPPPVASAHAQIPRLHN